jgi:hypothetical protein
VLRPRRLEHVGPVDLLHGQEGGGHAAGRHERRRLRPSFLAFSSASWRSAAPLVSASRPAWAILTVETIWVGMGVAAEAFSPGDKAHFGR